MTEPKVLVPDAFLLDRATFEGYCRGTHWPSASGVVLFGQWEARLPVGDESVAPCLRDDGFWESWVSLALARHLRPGMKVVDVGAHVGWYTLLALACGAARVLAVEPQPEVSALLRRTLRGAGLGDLVDHWVGCLGPSWGVADLHLYGRHTGNASLSRAEGWDVTETLRTGVAPLDGLLDSWGPWSTVDVVKVDAEGAEAGIWDGMRKTLERNPHALVVMEVARNRGYDLDAFLGRLEAGGWPVLAVQEDGGVGPLDAGPLDAEGARWATLWLRK